MKSGAIEFRHHTKTTSYPASASVTDVTAATTDTCPLTHPIVFIDSAAGAVTTYTVPNGEEGQLLVLISTDAANVDVIPTTSTDFASIALDEIGDRCNLLYVDDTTGWIIMSLGSLGGTQAPIYVAA